MWDKHIATLTSEVERTLSNDEALSILVEYKFSKRTYQGIVKVGKENNCKLYPSYDNVLKAKKRCYPPRTSITITGSCAEVKLQALLDHTAERILFLQREVIGSLAVENARNIRLICKWGCDGSSGRYKQRLWKSVYKQKFTEGGKSDGNVYVTSLVPLQLVYKDHISNTEIVVWKNPRPSSSRFCRPIRLHLLLENVESVLNDVDDIEQQVESLVPFTTQVNGMEICVKYNMTFTMIDSKVCSAVPGTKSAQRCYLCGATSKEFNNIDEILQKKVTETNVRFGISMLHAWIRFFECCLHLSYKLEIKKWQANTKREKRITEDRKKVIQKGFRLQLGLIVDRPIKPGYGSTNDGSTARRFFKNSSISATITGVSEHLINRFHVILQAISSGHNIKCDKFREYALETARKFVELYPWYDMPTSVHKLLIHGPEIIASALLLPIGQLSEEARNKNIKKLCKNFSRKCSRDNIQDVFNQLMVTSDPYISSIRKLPQRPLESLLPETIELLESPTAHAAITDEMYTDTSESSESSETDTHIDIYCDSDTDIDFDFCP
ncbi:PREDICTED: uncharacterized protein LOC105450347 [Wasmannia auropunctata]|uniref:uncharacterized protein LOC105450347 n=1 Tax=Wasmannia auropunctata TaxID=64793 RepID=UPI0005EE221C|nr:PREDICTED: uncharacterized protein LOC105450347 [Wasmannia auropunctata]